METIRGIAFGAGIILLTTAAVMTSTEATIALAGIALLFIAWRCHVNSNNEN